MNCKMCKNTGCASRGTDYKSEAITCYGFIPVTNADRVRAMDDEELAMQLAMPYVTYPPWCSENIECPYLNQDPTPCDKCALEWLSQEAKE